jgi:hypothetical protein
MDVNLHEFIWIQMNWYAFVSMKMNLWEFVWIYERAKNTQKHTERLHVRVKTKKT